MRTVGKRTGDGAALDDQGALARTAAVLRGSPWLTPKGVFRFHSFEEADAWMSEMLHRTHERLSQTTSSASVRR
jgi:hypothetical protein